jgi:phosphopantetheine--protein transferase-like protein
MTEDNLRELVSTLGRIERGRITAESSLAGIVGNSLGMAKLDANLRSKYSISTPEIYKASTYGELCAVLGIACSPSTALPLSTPSPASLMKAKCETRGVSIGVDVESIAAMPAPVDYWEDSFYKNTFTAKEIAYAMMQASPRASFAASWCAKEALRKADASLASMDWRVLEVVHDAFGQPSITINGVELPGTLSLSHTDEIAFAAYAYLPQPELMGPIMVSANHEQPVPSVCNCDHRTPTVLAVVALLVSVAALALAFLYH